MKKEIIVKVIYDDETEDLTITINDNTLSFIEELGMLELLKIGLKDNNK
jgi:hypothetical protein